MDRFDKELVTRAAKARANKPEYKIPPRQQRIHMCAHSHGHGMVVLSVTSLHLRLLDKKIHTCTVKPL